MAQAGINPKIEELRSKLKADPKSRLFYQLAEELRRAGQAAEAEHVLRTGLSTYPTYLAAWVSLGRTLRELNKNEDAVEALSKALQLDPGNVVAARLLGDAYLALGEKLEALKKYKLVHALLPADEDLQGVIQQLDRDLNPPAVAAAWEPEPETAPVATAEPEPEPEPFFAKENVPSPFEQAAPQHELPPAEEESPFDKTVPPFEQAARSFDDERALAQATGDVEPMSFGHEESPFEEPIESFTSSAVEIEAPAGVQIVSAPLAAEVPAPVFDDTPTADSTPVFESEPSDTAQSADAGDTLTMADLYARQGLIEEARKIYEHLLARNPENAEVREKLSAISPRVNPKAARLERWLGKVGKKEVGHV